MSIATKLFEGSDKRKRAVEIAGELTKIEKDVSNSAVYLSRCDDITGLPYLAKLHFAIVTGAIQQVADGKIHGIHPSINSNIERLYEMVSDKVEQYERKQDWSDRAAILGRLKNIQNQLPLIMEIARDFVDYSAAINSIQKSY